MTWYFWVWGVASSLACLGVAIGAFLAVLLYKDNNDKRERWKTKADEAQEQATHWREEEEAVDRQVTKLGKEKTALERKLNEYGQVSP